MRQLSRAPEYHKWEESIQIASPVLTPRVFVGTKIMGHLVADDDGVRPQVQAERGPRQLIHRKCTLPPTRW